MSGEGEQVTYKLSKRIFMLSLCIHEFDHDREELF